MSYLTAGDTNQLDWTVFGFVIHNKGFIINYPQNTLRFKLGIFLYFHNYSNLLFCLNSIFFLLIYAKSLTVVHIIKHLHLI